MNDQAERIFPIFFGVWIVLGLFSAGLFFLNNNAALKRKVFPPLVIGVGVLFLGFVVWAGAAVTVAAGATLLVALITVLNLKSIKFCSGCGAYFFHFGRVSKDSYCMKCGRNHKEGSATKGAA